MTTVAVPPTAGTTTPRLRDAVAEMTLRCLRLEVRQLDALLLGLILPVTLMLLFVLVFGGAIDSGGIAYVDYVVPAILLLCTGFGAAGTAVVVASDVLDGAVDRFRVMGVSGVAVLTGHVVASVTRNVVSTVAVVVVALLLGFSPRAGAAAWLAVAGLLLLYVLAVTWVSVALGLACRSVQAAGAVPFAVLFLPYLSSAFVPTASMPGWLEPLATHQPVTPVVETLRALLLDGSPDRWAVAVAWCVAAGVLGVVAGTRVYRRRTAT